MKKDYRPSVQINNKKEFLEVLSSDNNSKRLIYDLGVYFQEHYQDFSLTEFKNILETEILKISFECGTQILEYCLEKSILLKNPPMVWFKNLQVTRKNLKKYFILIDKSNEYEMIDGFVQNDFNLSHSFSKSIGFEKISKSTAISLVNKMPEIIFEINFSEEEIFNHIEKNIDKLLTFISVEDASKESRVDLFVDLFVKIKKASPVIYKTTILSALATFNESFYFKMQEKDKSFINKLKSPIKSQSTYSANMKANLLQNMILFRLHDKAYAKVKVDKLINNYFDLFINPVKEKISFIEKEESFLLCQLRKKNYNLFLNCNEIFTKLTNIEQEYCVAACFEVLAEKDPSESLEKIEKILVQCNDKIYEKGYNYYSEDRYKRESDEVIKFLKVIDIKRKKIALEEIVSSVPIESSKTIKKKI